MTNASSLISYNALRLAKALDALGDYNFAKEAAAELRRQHAEIEALRAKLDKLEKQEPVAIAEGCDLMWIAGKQIATEINAFLYLAAGARPVEEVPGSGGWQSHADMLDISEMDEVAQRFAHSLALKLECVLASLSTDPDSVRFYNEALNVLGEYRSAMDAIHEQHSPTHMGEPLLHNAKLNTLWSAK